MESPVFAFPLLLKLEPCVEELFAYSFSWNFECSQCGHKYQNRLVFLFFKTIFNGFVLMEMVPSNDVGIKLAATHSAALSLAPPA